jgi:predicted dehydrogenase
MALRVGVIGAGLIASRAHLPAVAACADVDFAALVDISAARARDLADRFGHSPRIATNVDDVIGELDAVIIATPNESHCELAVRCLEAGVHVLIEKPLATSVAEGEVILAAARKAGKVAAVGYNWRYLSVVRLLKELLEDGYFGELRRFVYQFSSLSGWAPLSGYNLRRTSAGGGVLAVNGSHLLDCLVYWFGVPRACACVDDSCGGPEATAVCWFRYGEDGRGFEGEVRVSKTVALPEGFVLQTDRGIVIFREERDDLIFQPRDRCDFEWCIHPTTHRQARRCSTYLLQLEDFVTACRTGCSPMVPIEQGLATQRVIEALYATRQPLRASSTAPLPPLSA